MPKPRRVVFLAYPGIQGLDLIGPLDVFDAARRATEWKGMPSPYRTEVVARSATPMKMTNGLSIVPERALDRARGDIDTLIVPGGWGSRQEARQPATLSWLRRRASRTRRTCSVCSGSFLLAAAGLLDGKRATTHWSAVEEFSKRFPSITVSPDSIFVRDGSVWTSAGVTAGIDLALALVEDDLGRDIALMVARYLVIFARRPGGQAQFSAQLSAQLAERGPVRDLQHWIVEHPETDLAVPNLARQAGMSPRHFARVFREEVGVTPADYVERVRVETARRMLETSRFGIEEIAGACGFGTPETLRRAFARRLGTSPAAYRQRFAFSQLATG